MAQDIATDDKPIHALKRGQAMNTLDWQTMELIFAHPAHIKNYRAVRGLITMLRNCRTPEDYLEFEKHLFQAIHTVEIRRSECAQSLKRLEKNKQVKPGITLPPHGLVDDEIDKWRLEAFVYERIWRQLRSVGDALAWQVFGYNRQVISTMSRNTSPGPMSSKEGLKYELGTVQELWDKTGHFALLHDITNCLRIGDITEFTSDGAILREVKSSPDRSDPAQMARMQQALDALLKGGRLPGHQADARLELLKTKYATDLAKLRDLFALARKEGFKGMRLAEGRAVTVFALAETYDLYRTNPEEGLKQYMAVRQAAIKRAGIDKAQYHAQGSSSDTATRSPTLPPWAIYPFSVEDCASLTCDLIRFETVLSIDSFANELEKLGFGVEIKMPKQHGQLVESTDVLRATLNGSGITLHGGGTTPMLYELAKPSIIAQGMFEVMTNGTAAENPVAIFAEQEKVWWQPPKNSKKQET